MYGLAYVSPAAPFQILGFVWQKSNGLIALAYILGGVCMYFTARSYAVMTEAGLFTRSIACLKVATMLIPVGIGFAPE